MIEALERRDLLAVYVVPGAYLSTGSGPGLTGSYVNQSLRSRAAQDDWRSAADVTVSGTRVDPVINFGSNGLGTRSPVGITGGSDSNWENFSVQWDGFVTIAAAGTRLYTRSDDSSRMWVDFNNDGGFDASGAEFINNGWGNSQGTTTSGSSPGLALGTYRIRIQYEEGNGDNRMYLGWSDGGHSMGLLDAAAIITESGSISASGETDVITFPLQSGDLVEIQPLGESRGDPAYAPAVDLLLPDGSVFASSDDGHSYRAVVPVGGTYSARITGGFVQRAFSGAYTVSIRSTPFVGTAEAESNGTTGTANALNTAQPLRGSIANASDMDYFRFTGNAQQTVVVKPANRTSTNPATRLHNSSGTVIASGMNGAGLVAVLPGTGTYYISFRGDNAAGNVSGEYAAQVMLVATATLEPAGGGEDFDNAANLSAPQLHVVPGAYLSQTLGGAAGLRGSFVNQSLRGRATQDDWRTSQAITGTRIDSAINFPSNGWGLRSAVGVTGGNDSDWENFSVQWDGYLTIPRAGTRLYTRSDDSSRMWIDLNNDGVYATSGSEYINNNWGTGQGATTGSASTPLAAGTYRIRIQYEEGGGDNVIFLLWDDGERSAGPVAGAPALGAGSLSSVSDVDLYAVDLVAGTSYDFRLEASGQAMASQGRVIAVFNPFGQMLAYGLDGDVSVDVAQSRGGRHLVAVSADSAAGIGGYALSVTGGSSFPTQRDVTLYWFDFANAQTYYGYSAATFTRTDLHPVIMGMFEAALGVNDIDFTTTRPAAGVEHVAMGIGDVASPPWGGLGGGSRGSRAPSGSAIHDVSGEAGWTRHDNASWVYGVTRHEAGHATGFVPHERHAINTMSYDNQLDVYPPGEFIPFGDNPLPARNIFRDRDYLDWMTQAGRYVHEAESNDTTATAQDLMPYLAEMSTDAEARNDKVVLLGLLNTPADVDLFRITATAGQAFRFDIDSAEFQNPLDATLILLNGAGNELARSTDAIDADTGYASVDPYLTHTFAAGGTYYIRVQAERGTWGNYRLKVAPDRAWDRGAPRVLASWPDGGKTVDGTRQLMFWLNKPLDPATLTAGNIIVRRSGGTVIPGAAWFDPLDQTLIWRANTQLPADTYTITFRGGAGGVADLYGNLIDGDTSGTLAWPAISGNGVAGGDFVTRFTVSGADNTTAAINSLEYRRHSYNFGQLTLRLSDEVDYTALFTSPNLSLRQAGPDGLLGNADDVIQPLQVAVSKVQSIGNPQVYLYTFGALEPGQYRLDGSILDAAGRTVAVSRTFAVAGSSIPGQYLQTPGKNAAGLTGSYVNRSLRTRSAQDDWRIAADVTVSGTRINPTIDFTTDTWGSRAGTGVTGGSDSDWENFSVQWDGWVTIPANGVRLFTRSDDGSRMWIDINGDGLFSPGELTNNNWGVGQGATLSPASAALSAGQYRIRVQYEEGNGGNDMQLIWDWEGATAGSTPVRTTNVAKLNIQPGTVISTLLDRVDVTFSGPIDPATLGDGNFRLRYSSNPTFFDGDDSFVTDADGLIAWDATRSTATLQTLMPLPQGYYLVELNGRPGGITDEFGRLLDGDYLDATVQGNTQKSLWMLSPSGDGFAGGDYRAFFSVQRIAGEADETYVRRNGTKIEVFQGSAPIGQPSASYDAATLQELRGFGGEGDDRLRIDFASGNPIPPGGIQFDGSAGDDELIVTGTPAGAPPRIGVTLGAGNNRVTLINSSIELDITPGQTVSLTTMGDAQAMFAQLPALAALDIRDGSRVVLPEGAGTVAPTSLQISPTGTLDLADNTLRLQPASLLAQVEAWIASARNAPTPGAWAGRGILSRMLVAGGGDGLAAVIDTAGAGPAVKVLIACEGDANLDATLNGDDYFLVDQAFLVGGGGWRGGDFDHSQAIDARDYFLLDAAFLNASATSGLIAVAAPVAPAPAAADEPLACRPDLVIGMDTGDVFA